MPAAWLHGMVWIVPRASAMTIVAAAAALMRSVLRTPLPSMRYAPAALPTTIVSSEPAPASRVQPAPVTVVTERKTFVPVAVVPVSGVMTSVCT